VVVEAARPESPKAVLSGHRLPVTCVAVSKGAAPYIVSGSEDHEVRVWKYDREEGHWLAHCRLDHHAAVQAVACTPKASRHNLLLTGTANGVARLFDLDELEAGERRLQGQRGGAITCVAFSPSGEVCATGGGDHSICLWKTAGGERLHRIGGAHKGAVTSLAFASESKLLSAGADNQLIAWKVEPGEGPVPVDSFAGRGGDVAQLGVSPDGKHVLFDQGKALGVLSLEERQIVGALQNPPGADSFTTVALFSPDGKTILTAGRDAGRVQLWRAPPAGQPKEKADPSKGKDAPKGKPDLMRGAELRQLVWSGGAATSGAFAPDQPFVVTGTQDHKVLVWEMPTHDEVSRRLTARLLYVEEFQDTSVKKVPIRAELPNPGWLMPGGLATMVIRVR
jgi:WD40 repeat protein